MHSLPIRRLVAAILIIVSGPCFTTENAVPEDSRLKGALVEFVEPTYPMALRFRGVTSGFALVWLTVDPAGAVLDAYATEFSHQRFADSSVEAIRRWAFVPDESGSRLPRLFSVRIEFSLGGMVVMEVHASDDVDRRRSAPVAKPAFMSYSFDDLDRVPEAIRSPMPLYPEALKSERKTGRVEILFHVDKSGRVRVPLVTYSDDPRFAEAALAAVSQWSFPIPRRGGRPASAFALQRFDFGVRRSTNG